MYIRLDKVYYSNNISKNLLSGNLLSKMWIYSEIKLINNKTILTLKKVDLNYNNNNYNNNNNKIKIIGTYTADENNIIRIPIIQTDSTINIITKQQTKNSNLDEYSANLWHRRLGHFQHENLAEYLNLHNIRRDDFLTCKIAKLKRLPQNGNPPNATRILEIIHSDLIGPINIISCTGKRFIFTFIDEYSRKSWIYLLESKRDVPKTTTQFLKYITNCFNDNIKFFKTDNGLEFKNRKIENYCAKNGITKIYSPPYNPQNNGRTERFNQTLINCAKTMLTRSKLDQKIWDYAVYYGNYLYNIHPHKGIGNNISNEIFFNKQVNLKYIRIFGCISYYKIFDQDKGKFESNSKKGVFLDLNFKTHCYIIMDYESLKIHLVREAIFDEDLILNNNIKLHIIQMHTQLNYFLMTLTKLWNSNKIQMINQVISITIIWHPSIIIM